MSKKNQVMENTNEAMENTNEVKFMHVLDAIREVAKGVEPSLKGFALALDVPPTRLYAKAKTPIAGQVYDPEAKNWDALNEFFVSKLEAEDAAYASMEELVMAAADKDKWLAENVHARVATGSNLIDVDGGKMPKRKAAMFEMGSEQESLICFKKDANVYKMVYQTLGYTCIRAVNEDGSFAKEEVRVISNATLNTKCVPPYTMAQAIADRFSGAYAEQTNSEGSAESENANQEANGEADPAVEG